MEGIDIRLGDSSKPWPNYFTSLSPLLASASGDPQSISRSCLRPTPYSTWGGGGSIQKERNSLMYNGTGQKIRRKDVPQGHQVIECKWVFKTKANGV